MSDIPQPTLPDGRPIIDTDGTLIPQARTFAAIFNSVSKVYSYRYDESLRDSPQNALAMRRDVHYQALLQERLAPTINNGWQIDIDDIKDKRQLECKDKLTKLIRAIPRFARMKSYLMQAVWYGRYGSQPCWENKPGVGFTCYNSANPDWSHEPVNGDKIQYQWDGTPVIMIDSTERLRFQAKDPDSIVMNDRSGFGLRLYKPEYRERFIIHTHVVDDADYFEGEMAGGARGVGLRSMIYWADFLRRECFQWMLGFMESVGLMDLMIFNYTDGNKAAKAAAEKNAKTISGKLALAVPRAPGDKFQAIEVVQANAAGIGVLRDLIEGYFDRGIERLIVGQSMSAGGGGSGGLEGDGRAEFAKDTKSQLLKFDADNLDETFTIQLVERLKRWNCPGTEDFEARFKSCNPEADRAKKFENGLKLVQAGIKVKVDELREAAGDFTRPTDGDETVGGEKPEILGRAAKDGEVKPPASSGPAVVVDQLAE